MTGKPGQPESIVERMPECPAKKTGKEEGMRKELCDIENVRVLLSGAFFAAGYKAVELFKCYRYTGKITCNGFPV